MPPIPASEVSDAEVAQIVEYLKTIKWRSVPPGRIKWGWQQRIFNCWRYPRLSVSSSVLQNEGEVAVRQRAQLADA